MTNAELKDTLMKDLEAEIDNLLEACEREGGRRLTLSEIEDGVLEVRQRLGQKMAERMIEHEQQAAEVAREAPISAVSGKRLERKGKKTRRSRRA